MTSKSSPATDSTHRLNTKMADRPIAIIGMSALFPDAPNLHQYWDNIINKLDSIIDIPESRWKIEDYYDSDPDAPDKTYCKRGGFLPDVDFNPMEFGIPPNILEVTDSAQLLGLLVAKAAMKDAGYSNPTAELLDATGVILGVVGGLKLLGSLTSRLQYPLWEKVLRRSGISADDTAQIIERMKKAYVRWEENSFPGLLGNVIAGRIANRLNLGGTNCTVDAACASSFSALKMAISDLLEYRSDMMISGGVDADNSPLMYMCFSKTPAFTKGGNPRPFDENSGGVMIGEGMGMIVIKRLEDAERDGDRIYAVIKGVGTSSDGKFKSIYAPRSGGQAKALRRAYLDADVDRLSIGLLEAHGTGTAAGDAAEFDGLKEVFAENRAEKSTRTGHFYPDYQHVALGSIKSQIGHTKAAAGIAGLIKTTLALHHKVLPPTLNIERPAEKLGIEKTPFYLNSEARPWLTDGRPRRAGVSAFGFGGTNFHYVLEEFQTVHSGAFRMHKTPQVVFLSAATPQELHKVCGDLLSELRSESQSHDAEQRHRELLQNSRENSLPEQHARLGFVTESLSETIDKLGQTVAALESKADKTDWNIKGIAYRQQALATDGKVVALFSGQGSQYLNMGQELFFNFPSMSEPYSALDAIRASDFTNKQRSLSDVVFPIAAFDDQTREKQQARLQLTENAQPAIGGISAGFYRILHRAGFQADFTAGHSFGELTALWAAGAISEEDYYRLAYARGQAMAAPDDPDFDAGSMLAVMGKVGKLAGDIVDFPDVVTANLNSKKQVVLAGPTAEILKAHEVLKAKKYTVVKLPVSAAFHTPLVGHAQKPFAKAIRAVKFHKPACPVYSNATAKAYPTTPKAIQKRLEEHILNSVRFREEIENIYQNGGRIFVEFGPKNVLTKLVDNILSAGTSGAGKEYTAIALNENPKKGSDRQFREAVVKLCVIGLPLQKFDPYALPLPELPVKKSGAISMNGANYVSEATKKFFEDALNDGFQVKTSTASTISKPSAGNSQQSAGNSQQSTDLTMSKPQNPVGGQSTSPQVLETLERSLSGFYQHQNETLQVHRQYLDQQSEYARTVNQLMQQQISLASQGAALPPGVAQNMQMFHSHQGETLRVHEQYLLQQSEQTQTALEITNKTLITNYELGRQGNANIAPIPAAPPAPATVPVQSAPVPTPVPLQVAPTLPTASTADKPSTVNTSTSSGHRRHPAPDVPVAPDVPASTDESLTGAMLSIVSEKTGYPQEMLELSMDMESDLGIDSIKRVEILGSVQDKIPTLPEIPADELAEMRTLGQIVEHLQSKLGGNVSGKTDEAPLETIDNRQPSARTGRSGVNQTDPGPVLMSIISEKTGYPPEMLELGMDIEADLGIDSIKRVEIMWSLQEQFPELPQIGGSDVADLRTVGQIADYVKGLMPTPELSPQTESAITPVSLKPNGNGELLLPAGSGPGSGNGNGSASVSASTGEIAPALLAIISEKTGYPAEMLELNMDMEADLGIDSIKRVEIMWSLQEQLPHLPQISGNEMSELRTLQEIVSHLEALVPSAEHSGGTAVFPPPVAENMESVKKKI